MTPRVGYGQTAAKIILFGEHSVVYGHPAIALPLPALHMSAGAQPIAGESTLTSLDWSGPQSRAPQHFSPIRRATAVASEFAGHSGAGLAVSTRSHFPPQRGLGSSAAAAGAVIRAILDAYQVSATAEELFELTQEAERVAHGRPSGLDAVVTCADSPVHFQAGLVSPLNLPLDAWITIADSGVTGSTRETVGHVRAQYEAAPRPTGVLLNQLAGSAVSALGAMRAGDMNELGRLMTGAHHVLADLGVSIDELDALVATALASGALGAKLTGGGGGGCIIALADTREQAQKIQRALLAAGAADVWLHAPIRARARAGVAA